jgi:O-antigen/teichoic acid export membrane protein
MDQRTMFVPSILALSVNLTLSERTAIVAASNPGFHLGRRVVLIVVLCLGLVFILMGTFVLMYRRRLNKTNPTSVPAVVSDGATVLFLPTQ